MRPRRSLRPADSGSGVSALFEHVDAILQLWCVIVGHMTPERVLVAEHLPQAEQSDDVQGTVDVLHRKAGLAVPCVCTKHTSLIHDVECNPLCTQI